MEAWQFPSISGDHPYMLRTYPHVLAQDHTLPTLPPLGTPAAPSPYSPQDHALRTYSSTSSFTSSTTTSSGFSGLGDGWSWDAGPTLDVDEAFRRPTRASYSQARGGGGGGGVGLSIDPKLFQPKSRASSGSYSTHGSSGDGGSCGFGEEHGQGEGEEEEGMMTAKPNPPAGQLPKTPKTPRANATAPTKGRRQKGRGEGKKAGQERGEGKGRKVSHARKQHPDHIPRPRNAFILFRKHVVDSKLIPASVEMRHQNVSIITAKMWAEASPDQKAHFNALAKLEKDEHMRKYPEYRYQPVYRRTNVIRRRVRKDEAEEEKCQEVADLLLQGKSGPELESQIMEKISAEAEAGRPGEAKGKKGENGNIDGQAGVGLSKGALRALRAQAREASASASISTWGWSDISRDTSLAPSLADAASLDGQLVLRHQSSGTVSEPAPFPSSRDPLAEYPEETVEYMTPPPLFHHPPFGLPAPAAWENPAPGAGPDFAFPNYHDQHMGVITDMGMGRPLSAHAYPQPAHAGTDFYALDQALPFSPSASAYMTTFDPSSAASHMHLPQSHGNSLQEQLPPVQHPNMPSDLMFSSWGPSFSPTAPLYAPLTLDAMGGGNEGMLDDFGHALAQAQELGTW